jgi:O-antigen ligase
MFGAFLLTLWQNASMNFLRTVTRAQWIEWSVLSLLVLSVLWRGGKSVDTTWILTGVAGCAILFSPRSAKTERGIPLHLWLAVLLFIFWTVASYMQSTTANYGLDEVLRTTSLSVLFLWAVRNMQTSVSQKLVRVLSITALLAGAIGVFIYIFQPVNRFVGTFFDYRFHTDYWPNAWATFLLLAWPIVYAWVFSQYVSARRIQYGNLFLRIGVLSFILCCLLLSFSRGGLVAFGGQLLLWAGILYSQQHHSEIWKKIIGATVLCFAMSLLMFAGVNSLRGNIHDVLSVEQKITFSADEGSSSIFERSIFWKQSFSLANQKPFFGWGPYSFRFVQPHVQRGILATSDHPHNLFLKYAMERGWIAAFLFLYIALSVLIGALRNNTLLSTASFVAVSGALSHSLIDYNLQFVGNALVLWLLLAFLARSTSRESVRTVSPVLSRSVEGIIAVLLLLVASVEGGYLVTSSIGRHAETSGDTRVALRWYERSNRELFSRDLELSRSHILLENGQYIAAELALNRYVARNAEDARVWKNLAVIAQSKNDYSTARMHYEKAYVFGKYNDIGITLGLVQSLLSDENEEEIVRRKAEFDELINMYASAIVVNAHFIALSPNIEAFVELCELFADLFPDEAPVYYVLAAKADDHAREEREKMSARLPGFLW